jgi:uncharacterized protein (UPF0276 family)
VVAAAAAASNERALGAGCIGAGVSLRRAHIADAFAQPQSVDLIEIIADHFFSPAPSSNPTLAALRERFTIVPHGLDLSLGSAEGIDVSYLRRLAAVIDAAGASYWSEHIAFTRAGGRSIGHLAPLPFTHEALDVLSRNIATALSKIPVRLILENIACPFDVPHADMSEAEFLARLVDRTGCGLLLDVTNLYYNTLNRAADVRDILAGYPLHAVVQCHLAGGHRAGSEWIDSHAFAVPEPVWELFAEVAKRAPLRAVIVERDENLPQFSVLADEVARARAILRDAAG